MKYLVSCILALPVLTACVEQQPYYQPDYPGPAPRVEIERNDPRYHKHYNSAPQQRVYHGHVNVNPDEGIVHHHSSQGGVEVQANSIHEHGSNNNASSQSGGAVVVPGKVRGQYENQVHGKSQQPVVHSDNGSKETTEGHHHD